MADNAIQERGISSNGSTEFKAIDPGLYIMQVYAPAAGTSNDPCGVAGGDWDGATATLEYTPDNGLTIFNIDVPGLVGITDDAIDTVQVGRGYQFRTTVSGVGAATCITFYASKSQ